MLGIGYGSVQPYNDTFLVCVCVSIKEWWWAQLGTYNEMGQNLELYQCAKESNKINDNPMASINFYHFVNSWGYYNYLAQQSISILHKMIKHCCVILMHSKFVKNTPTKIKTAVNWF